MSVTAARYEHIFVADQQIALDAGTTMYIIALVLATQTYGWSAEELHYQYSYLSLGQMHSALAYYWDCKTNMDADLAQRAAQVATLRQPAPVTPLLSRIYVQRGQ